MDDEVAAAWKTAAEELRDVDVATAEGKRAVLAAYRRARATERRVKVERWAGRSVSERS